MWAKCGQKHAHETYSPQRENRPSIGKHVAALLGDGWSTHSLRHRYATATYRATACILLVSRLLGHESVETTQRYVAMPDDRLRIAVDAVRLSA